MLFLQHKNRLTEAKIFEDEEGKSTDCIIVEAYRMKDIVVDYDIGSQSFLCKAEGLVIDVPVATDSTFVENERLTEQDSIDNDLLEIDSLSQEDSNLADTTKIIASDTVSRLKESQFAAYQWVGNRFRLVKGTPIRDVSW